jgi:hypothetical protein
MLRIAVAMGGSSSGGDRDVVWQDLERELRASAAADTAYPTRMVSGGGTRHVGSAMSAPSAAALAARVREEVTATLSFASDRQSESHDASIKTAPSRVFAVDVDGHVSAALSSALSPARRALSVVDGAAVADTPAPVDLYPTADSERIVAGESPQARADSLTDSLSSVGC